LFLVSPNLIRQLLESRVETVLPLVVEPPRAGEAKARELVISGRSHELKLQVKQFSDAASAFFLWADSEYTEHPNAAKRLHASFVSLSQFFQNVPVSSILRGHVNDYKALRRKEHAVREITIRHDLHALSKAFGYFVDHNWARENPVRGVEIPSDKDAVGIHVLTSGEEMLYFEDAKRFPALQDLGRLMLNQGCRPEEISCALAVSIWSGLG